MSILTKAPITSNPVFDFDLKENYIQTEREQVYAIRFFVPSLSIKTDEEKELEINRFQRLLEELEDSILALNARELIFFCTDKEENLEGNKNFWKSLSIKYYPYTSDIINSIDSKEVTSLSVQKACYIFLKTSDRDMVHNIYQKITGMNYSACLADKNELSILLRNFILREFTNTDINTWENQLSLNYDNLLPKQKKKTSKEQYFKSELSKSLTPLRVSYTQQHAQQNHLLRKVLMIKNIPSDSRACRLTELVQLKNTSFCMRITPMSKHLVTKLVNTQTQNKKVKFGSQKRTDSIDAENEISDIEHFYSECGKTAIYNTNIYLECYGNDKKELDKVISNAKGKLINITLETLNYQQKEGFQSLHPFGSDHFQNMANNIPVSSLSRLYPFAYSSRNDEQGTFLGHTSDGGNFFCDFLKRDGDITNGNFCVLGNSGQGKSYLAKKITSQLIFRGIDTFFLDPENEYVEMTQQLGGTVIDPTDGETIINPFEVRQQRDSNKEKNTDSDVKTSEFCVESKAFFQHLKWLKQFLRLTHHIDEKRLNILIALTQDCYKEHNIDEDTDINALSPTDYITYTEVYQYIEQCALTPPQKYAHLYTPKDYREILVAIQSAYNGDLSPQLNGHTNIKNDNIVCFAVRDLLSSGERKSIDAIMFNIITYVWNKIVVSKNRTCFVVDELSSLMTQQIMSFLKDIGKRIRKYKGLLGILTQNIMDVVESEFAYLASAIFAQCIFKFIFHPGDLDLLKVKKFLILSDGEINKISTPNQKHCLARIGSQIYYMKTGTLPYEKALFGKAGDS